VKYEQPSVARRRLIAQMETKASACADAGGVWDGQECIFKIP
jgi:hypothetical protein